MSNNFFLNYQKEKKMNERMKQYGIEQDNSENQGKKIKRTENKT